MGVARRRRAHACALGFALCAALGTARAQIPNLPACGPNASVVLRNCARAAPGDQPDARLKEKLERNARRLQERAEHPPDATDLGTVIVEGQRVEEPDGLEKFRAALNRRDQPFGRQPQAGTRGDRDNFGTRFECARNFGLPFDSACRDQPGRPATSYWMNGR